MSAVSSLRTLALRDVNPLLPVAVIGGAVAVTAFGLPFIGAGIAAGSVLAYVNSALLARRIQLATATGDTAAAMISMQLGLLVTFTVVAGITVLMVLISRPMTVAMAITFFVVQTAELALYYRARRGRDVSRPAVTSHKGAV
ncbi:MAG TPA: hypothetical protein VFB34_05235 [Chloroflexota bacterium]|nr:hypothetical protein [Chloroflexota bacterium]